MAEELQPQDGTIDVGDIPIPSAAEQTGVEDAFGYHVAFKFAFVGLGQAGSRLAETFYEIGYRRVCAVNTTNKDLIHIKIPESSKLVLKSDGKTDFDGAGKDPSLAEAVVADKGEEIYDLIKRCCGTGFTHVFVCIGAGGGTGAGTFSKTIEVLRQLMAEMKVDQHIGIIAALPKNDEGQKVAKNSLESFKKLQALNLSPVIIIDNERIKDIYPRTPVNQFWQTANKGICTLLHLFNRIAAQSSQHTTFDPADFATLLDSGVVAFGATAITDFNSQADISKAIRQQLRSNVLASVDISKGRRAGCIFIGSDEILGKMPMEFLDHAFTMLSRIMADDSVVHRGVYVGSRNDLRVYTMIGQLPYPIERLAELARLAGQQTNYSGG